MKKFWKQPQRDEFLELAGLYLLYAFILSIAANPFIMWFVGMEKFAYVKVETSTGYPTMITDKQQEIIDKYRVVDQHYIDDMKEFETRIGWITITALLGWCVTSPRFNRGWPKLVAKFKSNESFSLGINK